MTEKRAQDTMMIQNLNILYRYVIEGVVNMKPDLYLEMLRAGCTQSRIYMNHFVVYTINNCSYKETTKGLSKYK